MPGFKYHANLVGVRGQMVRPERHTIDPQASCTLPEQGGSVSSSAGPFSLILKGEFIFSYDSIATTIAGSESGGVCSTMIHSVIHNLDVEHNFRFDEIILDMKLRYDLGARKFTLDTSGSKLSPVWIGGERWNIDLDHAMSRDAADFERFKHDHPEHIKPDGKARYSLARHPKLKFDGDGHGHHHHSGMGRIYFGEWTAAKNTQTLTLLRFKLGSPGEGDLLLGEGEGNGDPPPPGLLPDDPPEK